MTESEVWKDIAEYEGVYQVSNRGNVRSVAQIGSQGYRRRGRVLAPCHNSRGYYHVVLSKNGKVKTKSVHRLVAETFLPNPNGLSQVNHRDEDKDNNNVENLEWCTSKYNNSYGTRRSKKVRAVNIKTGEVVKFNSLIEAKHKGYAVNKVSMACRGTYKTDTGKLVGDGRTYKGFRWYYDVEEENVSK